MIPLTPGQIVSDMLYNQHCAEGASSIKAVMSVRLRSSVRAA